MVFVVVPQYFRFIKFSKTMSLSKEYFGNLRTKYDTEIFTDHFFSKDPIELFKYWFEEARNAGIVEPNSMCLSTVDKTGKPSARFVLLKEFNKEGFKFFTNYTSTKGKNIAVNDQVALTFYWQEIHRQIRVEGTASKVSREESEEYFHSRPFDSQVSASVSNQSEVICNRDELSKRSKELTDKYLEIQKVPLPDTWGGYLVKPKTIEFWLGHTTRLHDRIRYRKLIDNEKIDESKTHEGVNGWFYERLSP